MSSIDWPLTDELVMIRDTARRFMKNDVRPAEDKCEHDAFHLQAGDHQRLQKKARELGLWCIRSPREFGGTDLDLMGQAIVAEEAARCKMGVYLPACGTMGFDPPGALFTTSQYQREKYAIPAVESGTQSFVAVSEASGGSDPAGAIRTRAAKKGDRYILNGTKLWISGLDQATKWGLVLARTGEQNDPRGISCFIVDIGMKGFTYHEIKSIRSYPIFEMTFEDCEVPAENLVGAEGSGLTVLSRDSLQARISYAAGAIGVAQEALEMAIDWVKQRTTFGAPLADRQAIQHMIVDSEMELQAARMLVYKAAHLPFGVEFRTFSSMIKVTSTETAGRVVDRCIQMLGGLGVAQEMPLERWFRELRIKRIGAGPSEIHRLNVARDILGAAPRAT